MNMKLFVKTVNSKYRDVHVHFFNAQVTAPTSALPTTQQTTPSPSTTAGENGTASRNAGENGTASRNAEVEVRQPDILVVLGKMVVDQEMSRFIGKSDSPPPKKKKRWKKMTTFCSILMRWVNRS